jgi:hypothetical protein
MRHAPALRFAVIGAAGFLVDLAALSAALWLSAGPAAARPVLRHCRHVHLASQPALYLLLIRPSLGTGVGALRPRQFWRRRGQPRHIWSDYLPLLAHTFAPQIGVAFGSIAGLGVNYLGSKLWVFSNGKRVAGADSNRNTDALENTDGSP